MTTGPTSHRFISQRMQLHYVDWGNPDAPSLLLVHGGLDHCRSWDWVAEELCKEWHVIAPDLRGHGDSAWSSEGDYNMATYVYDIAQLIHQLKLAPVVIVGHSLGGSITLRYSGLYPGTVRKLAIIEGLGPSPKKMAKLLARPIEQRVRDWIDEKRTGAGRRHKRYHTLEEACHRMKTENSYLSDVQARHLTLHGISQNEDGTYSWKFDNYARFVHPVDISPEERYRLWNNITCPVLLLYGEKSWASNPEKDGRAKHFRNAKVTLYKNAGHWLHHDQFDRFIADIKAFL